MNDSSKIINTLRCESYRSNDTEKYPNLYRVGDIFTARTDDYFGVVMAGSSSDKLFHDKQSFELMGLAGMKVYGDDAHTLNAGLFYSKENLLPFKYNIPIPIITYQYKSQDLTAVIGLPTMIFWKLTQTVSFNFNYVPAVNIDSSITYRPLPFISLGPVFLWKINRFLPENMTPHTHHLYNESVQLLFKVQSYISKYAGVYIAGGYSFRDRYYHGTSSFDRHDIDDRGMSPVVLLGAQGFMY
jgi:hypothetical protein